MTDKLKQYQINFIDFLIECEALTFGDFTTKSGRKTPYFINTGRFNTGEKISRLGEFYAEHLVTLGLDKQANIIFGPAYKGIPLCVSTAASLSTKFRSNIGFTFDRKEVKEHGDGGRFVGSPLNNSSKVILVEDVITAGTTMREIVPLLRGIPGLELLGAVIAVDRSERGTEKLSAVQEVQQNLNLPVYPIITIHDIVAYLNSKRPSWFSADLDSRIQGYIAEYGA